MPNCVAKTLSKLHYIKRLNVNSVVVSPLVYSKRLNFEIQTLDMLNICNRTSVKSKLREF